MPALGPFPGGINNRAQRGRLPTSKEGMPLFARNANNMVFNNEGNAFSIFGPEQVISGTRMRDGYSCPSGAFFRDGSTIKSFYKDESGQEQASSICSGIIGGRIAWAHFKGTVYFSDGNVCKKIVNGACENWGTPVPVTAPLLSGSSVLGSGQVMACYSYLLDDGRESGTSPVVISSSGRVLSQIQQPTDSRVAAVRVYFTAPNDNVFYLAATILPGQPSVEITSNYVPGIEPETRGKFPPHPGQLICQHSGRIYIAAGNMVYFSDPNAHDLFSFGETVPGNPEWAAWQFAEDITLLESVTGGIFVGANGTFFIPGNDPFNPTRMSRRDSRPELGAVRRVKTGELIWKTKEEGFIKGSLDGQTERMNFDNVSMDKSGTGVSAMGAIDLNGTQAVIAVPEQPKPGKLRSKDWRPDIINDGCE